MADQVLMPTRSPMAILEMDFERILGVPFFIVVLTPSCCDWPFGATCKMHRTLDFCPEQPGRN